MTPRFMLKGSPMATTPTREDKFSFGLWTIGWVGQAFGARWTLIAGGLLTVIGVAASALLYLRTQRRTIAEVEAVPALTEPAVQPAA